MATLALIAGGVDARPICPRGLRPTSTAQVFFGLDQGGATVGQAQWGSFLDGEVAPRFPDGFTVWDARGQWRAQNGAAVREPAKVLLIVLAGKSGERARLAGMIEAYKTRFHQSSVLLVEHRDCVRF
jgi:hypothetical protein